MSLADAFGRRPAGAQPPTQPAPPAAQQPESLVPVAIWLRDSLRSRLNTHCRRAGIRQSEGILRAVEHAADHLAELAAPAPPAAAAEVGTLFPRADPAQPKDTGRGATIRFRADHLTTLDRLAADHHLTRSALVNLSLADYLDHLDRNKPAGQ